MRDTLDDLLDGVVDPVASWREHRFIGGPPTRRLYRMQIQHEVRARRLGVPWEAVDLRRVFVKCNGICGICHQPVSIDVFTVDHIVPLSKGGWHRIDNLQIAHRACNTKKGDR